jgi:hypothetical protein
MARVLIYASMHLPIAGSAAQDKLVHAPPPER